ncbi:1-phosphofructokinase family hexose kinase [Lentibacillus salicampi]|uniref:Tagatose-6-phosphate kinase n=1 Tax=Lentibacillus salicampi TaxID=175306 RepID=A0A4Y9A7F2_9BACI|nr:1-phosphofructokinase family hexose kinase [Lentibacillus salicampi]TFJ91679.1 1-phosphofructokinase family hexose kinase [Lentibacillus salicampi]
MIHVVCPNPALDRSIFLDEFTQDSVNRAKKSIDVLGGKGFNVIRSFLVQNKPFFQISTFLGGYTGSQLQKMITDAKIDSTVTEIKETTRICSIIVDESSGQVHVINEKGPHIDEDEEKHFVEKLISKVKPNDFAIFSGSLPSNVDKSFYYYLIHELEKKGAKCLLDSSGDYLKEGIKAEPWLVKINKFEFFDLFGSAKSEHNLESLIEQLNNVTLSSNFIITLGDKGSVAKINKKLYRVEIPTIKAKNPTASGDIFLGAFTKELEKNTDPMEALKTASAYSMANCLYWYPHIEESDIVTYKDKVEVIELGG